MLKHFVIDTINPVINSYYSLVQLHCLTSRTFYSLAFNAAVSFFCPKLALPKKVTSVKMFWQTINLFTSVENEKKNDRGMS